MESLEGKCAFVTGAASGIGLAIATSLASVGVRVVAADIDADALETAASGLKKISKDVLPLRLDVRSLTEWQEAGSRAELAMQRVDILCNNAGVGPARKNIEDITDQDWRWIFDINVHGIYNGIRTFLPRMRSDGIVSHIVNTGSIMSHFALGGASDYVTTKYAVLGLSESLRMELSGSEIGVSVLCPGLVNTNLPRTTENSRSMRGSVQSDAAVVKAQSLRQKPQAGIDPSGIGNAVVDAIRNNEFYIFSHPEYASIVSVRHEEVLTALQRSTPRGEAENTSFLGGGVLKLAQNSRSIG